MVLLLVGLVGGLLTGVSPCILPVLPVVFFGGATPGATDASTTRARPFLVVLGLTISFAAFTLFGAFVLSLLRLPSDRDPLGRAHRARAARARDADPPARAPAGAAVLVDPAARRSAARRRLLLGIALGAVFVPCAGPVLAAITVAGATGKSGSARSR